MKSTRSQLIIYFLVLLTVGLGTVFILADRVVDQVLVERQKASIEAIELRLAERIKNEREKFDSELLTHARLIGRVARAEYLPQSEGETRQFHKQLVPLYFINMGPMHSLWAVSWQNGIQPPRRGPSSPNSAPSLYWSLLRTYFSNLRLDELFIRSRDEDYDSQNEFVQINGPFSSRVSRSDNLLASSFSLPFDRRSFSRSLEDYEHSDVLLPYDQQGRRVLLKCPIPLLSFGRFPSSGSRGSSGRGEDGRTRFDPLQMIYIQVARETSELDRTIFLFEQEAAIDKLKLQNETNRTVRWVRFAIGLISLTTFLACIVGSSWLIYRGLKPLNQLSEAVSKVTEKDFHLTMNSSELTLELRPIHDRLQETLDQLKNAFDREKQAVADISHELRTPVASLLATIDVAIRKPRSTTEYVQSLTECRAITKQLGLLVEKIISLAYIDAGYNQTEFQDVDLRSILNSCSTIIRPLAQSHGFQFHYLESEQDLVLHTDPKKIQEVILNLLHNAIEYNRENGSITLAAEQLNKEIEISVYDTGIGIADEHKDKIFQRFYRVDASRTATGVHAGLGLSIVKEYVTQIGGNITLESKPGEGSTFKIRLPLNPQSQIETKPKSKSLLKLF